MARRLKTIAEWINAKLPELRAEVRPDSVSTDSQIAGTRFRRPGKGRRGNRIFVYYRTGGEVTKGLGTPVPIFDHNSAETYRSNDEVETWLKDYLACKEGRHLYLYKSDTKCSICKKPTKEGAVLS